MISPMLFSHLHFDHCEELLSNDPMVCWFQLFPMRTSGVIRAIGMKYESQPQRKALFLPENIRPIQESGQLQFLNGTDKELVNTPLGDFLIVDGHTEKQLLPKLEYQGETLFRCRSVTHCWAHPLPYHGLRYTTPIDFGRKSLILQRAADENWFCSWNTTL